MTRQSIERYALVAAGVVIVGLTAVAFWLSYAHLAEVAGAHGLGHAADRQWAWPGTLDAFIVAGELLMLRAGLQGRTDWWAVGLTVAGSGGSIGLNVAGVGGDAAFLDYVVAAVPPTAALLAFGALMRQIHRAVVDDIPAAVPLGNTVEIERDTEPSPAVPEMSPHPAIEPAPAPASPLVICGGHLDVPPVPQRPRLGAEDARTVIERAWRDGLSIRDAAKRATRSASQVQRVYAELDDARPIEGQTEIDVTPADAA